MDYTVKSLGKTCAGTGEPLAPGQVCHCVLVEEHGEKVRYDYSDEGWPGSPPEDVFAYWKTVVPEPENDDQPRPLEPEQLFEFFEQILEDMNPAQENMKYVIALLLMQKKRLKLSGTRDEEDRSYLVLSGSQGEGPFEVCDQRLSDDEIQQLQQELNAAIYR